MQPCNTLLTLVRPQGTIYGYGQNSKGACSYGANGAKSTGLPWATVPAGASDGGTGLDITYIAMNAPQWAGSVSCGSCLWFRGTGACCDLLLHEVESGATASQPHRRQPHPCRVSLVSDACIATLLAGPGIGVESRRISTDWQYGLTDNVCPECKTGALDLARSFDVGDGIWTIEWHVVPCQVSCDGMVFCSMCWYDAQLVQYVPGAPICRTVCPPNVCRHLPCLPT